MKTVNTVKKLTILISLMIMVLATAVPAFAAGSDDDGKAAVTQTADNTQAADAQKADSTGDKALGAAICVGIAAAAGAIGMGMAIGKSTEGISRQPEAEGKIRTTLMLGLVFIETAIIYALIVAILIVFVL